MNTTTQTVPAQTTAAEKKPMTPWIKQSIWATIGVATVAVIGFGVKVYLGRNSGN